MEIATIGKGFLGKKIHKNLGGVLRSRKTFFSNRHGLKNVKAIIYTSWVTDVDLWEKDPQYCFTQSIDPLKKIIGYCRRNNKKLVFISSDYANHPGTNLYGYAKNRTEHTIKKELVDYLIIRISDLFGEGRIYDYDYGATDRISHPTYDMDLISALEILINADAVGDWDICCDEKISRYEFIQYVNPGVQPVKMEELNLLAKRPLTQYLFERRKMKESFKWKPTPLHIAIAESLPIREPDCLIEMRIGEKEYYMGGYY